MTRRRLLISAGIVGVSLISCSQGLFMPSIDIDTAEARTRQLAEETAAGVAPAVRAVPRPENGRDACSGKEFRLRPVYELVLSWPEGEFDRAGLRDAAEAYFAQQGYSFKTENPDHEIVDVIAKVDQVVLRLTILAHKDQLVVSGIGPCVLTDAETYRRA